jgi:tricorn protease
MRKLLFISMACIAGLCTNAQSPEAYFLSAPCLTPDGQTVVFSFEGDLWKAICCQGRFRLTAMQGYENNAKISPDGKWVAFTGRQMGNSDVYVMPLAGGEIKQLTFHSAGDDMNSWSWDSKKSILPQHVHRAIIRLYGKHPWWNAAAFVRGSLFFIGSWYVRTSIQRRNIF